MTKKVFIIIFILTVFITLTGCANNDNKEPEDNQISELLGKKIDFVCEDLKNNDFYITKDNIYMNNSIYYAGDLYSNNQNCMKVSDISYDRYVNYLDQSIFIKDNKAYTYSQYNGEDPKLTEITRTLIYKEIALEDGVLSISTESVNNTSYGANFYVLKNDGNVYLYETDTRKILKKDEIIYSSEDYGKVKYFYYTSNSSKSDETIILLSDKGLFTNEEIKDENCTKYADIECKKEFKLNEKYEKIKDQVIFFNEYYIVDKDYNLYHNNFVE